MKKRTYEKIKETNTDLIPKASPVTGSYMCTWWNQSSAAAALGLSGTGLSEWRDALCQEAIFDREDLFHPMEKEMRSGIIFLIDDGWDLPLGTPNDGEHRHLYGAVDPDSKKFSRFGKTPEERLKGMSDAIKKMGYAGLGLWISPQEKDEGEYNEASARAYWEERARWSQSAGILYWKVDWGGHDHDDGYRQLMSECAHRCAPDLMVEHAVVQKPLTHHHGDDFPAHREKRVKAQMTFADAYRTYDVLPPFEEVCTLRRAHEAFKAQGEPALFGKGLVNAENLYSIAAGLGCAAGVMNYNTDAKACLRWHRLAPPFGIREGVYRCSEERLCDSLFFDTEICGWAPCKHIEVEESAPAIMARNCPLPKVAARGEHAPFVVASKNPASGAYCVAAIRRTVDPLQYASFPADVTLFEVDITKPVGVFGVFATLTLSLDSPIPEGYRLIAQDLISDRAIDVTEYATVTDEKISLDGKDLRSFGKWYRGHNDQSTPSLILKAEKI